MSDNQAKVNPKYLTYDKDQVQALLDKVNDIDMATESDVRSIVMGYIPDYAVQNGE